MNFVGKHFSYNWRLNEHVLVHTQKAKMCRYFVKNEHCPLNLIGCKFSHSMEPTDGKDAEDNKPTAEDNNADEATDESDAEQDYTTHENQCHLCKKQLSNKDEMWDHVETVHVEYFQGM